MKSIMKKETREFIAKNMGEFGLTPPGHDVQSKRMKPAKKNVKKHDAAIAKKKRNGK